MGKEEDILNECGHRNSERIEAFKKLPSLMCPACLFERIEELEVENKKLRAIKCPPISDGDSCICPIEELETTIKNACDLINDEGKVSKWKILNILNQVPKGK